MASSFKSGLALPVVVRQPDNVGLPDTQFVDRFGGGVSDEFTVQQGELWTLQTRSGKRTAMAALKIAVRMAAEGYDGEIVSTTPEVAIEISRRIGKAGAESMVNKVMVAAALTNERASSDTSVD